MWGIHTQFDKSHYVCAEFIHMLIKVIISVGNSYTFLKSHYVCNEFIHILIKVTISVINLYTCLKSHDFYDEFIHMFEKSLFLWGIHTYVDNKSLLL